MLQAPNIDEAIRIYYEKVTIDYKDIMLIFHCCAATANKLKREIGSEPRVNTDTAFRAWGMPIEELERRKHKHVEL